MSTAYGYEMYWAPSPREGEGLSCPSSQPMPAAARAKTLQKKPEPGYSCPGVDDRLVAPETAREEMLRGEKLIAMPANPAHAEQQQQLSYIIQSNTKSGYVGAADMLTRASKNSDFAVDCSIRRAGVDPQTGRRFLEEVAFEIVDTQSDRHIQMRAEDLIARGVRRVLAVFVRDTRKEVCEWSPQKNTFEVLSPDSEITDPVFVKPIRVRAILDAAEADNEVVQALEAKKNPVLEQRKREAFEEGRAAGELEGERRILTRLLEKRFGELSPAWLEQLRTADSEQLTRWMDRALEVSNLESVFA